MPWAWMLLVVVLGRATFPSPLHAQEVAPPAAVLPQQAEEAYARGDLSGGNKILNDLVAENPGNVELAVRALRRICIEEFFELLDTDWVDLQMRRRLMQNHRGDLKQVRQALAEHVRGALLRELEYESEKYKVPPINTLRRLTAESPIDGGSEHFKYLIRESLVRRQNYPELTSRDKWPDQAPKRLVALRRGGFVAPDHPAVVEASALLILIRRQQERYLEAVELMDELAAGCGNDLPWLLARAKFHHRVGSPQAGELFRQLFRRIGESHVDGHVQDVWQRAQPYAHYAGRQQDAAAGKGQSWLARMEPDHDEPDWAIVLRGRPGGLEQRVDQLIGQALGDNVNAVYMLSKDGTGVAACSVVLDAELKSLGTAELEGLRKSQETKCRNDRRAADLDAGSQSELLGLIRRYPWAATAHRAMQVYAQRELEAGHGQAARRAFQDLMEHTADPALRSRAQVGLWLAAAQQHDPNELAAAFEGTTDQEKFPWMGAEATAGTIRRRLLEGMPKSKADRTDAPALAALKPQLLKIPAVNPWPGMDDRSTTGLEMVSIQPNGSSLLVSSRNILAWYHAHDTSRPVWTQLRGTWEHDRSNGTPGLFRPAIDGETIYTRWGYRVHTSHLAAFDATTGRVLWGTAAPGPPQAERSVPFGNPVLSGGQLYGAAGRIGGEGPPGIHLHLTCVDADSGALVWNSEFVANSGTMRPHDWYQGVYGDTLTVCDGAVYCLPSAGVIVRCDARDGRMEWIRRYESEHKSKQQADSLGSAPIIAGDVLICLPRDADDVMGLDRETGRVLWKNSLVLPVEALGLFGGCREGDSPIFAARQSEQSPTLIVHGKSALAALDVRSGRVRWFTTLSEASIGRAVRLGSSVYMRTPQQLHRFDAATGIEEEVRPWPETDNPVSNFAIHGERLYLLTNEPCSVDSYQPGQPFSAQAAAAAGPLRFPLKPCWTLREYEPKLFVPPQGTSPENKALLHSNEIVKCVETTPRGGIAWQRFVGPRLQDVFFLDGKAILLFMHGGPRRLEALDLNTGNFAWKTELPATVHRYDRSGTLFFASGNDRLVAVDLRCGKIFPRGRLPGLSSGIQAGFGGGKIQVISSTRNSDNASVMYWMTCDPLTGQVAGAGEELRGTGGDNHAPILNVQLRNAAFGSQATYFTTYSRVVATGRPETFRCDYRDRSVRMIRSHTSICEFQSPYLLMSVEPQRRERRDDQLYTWVVLRDDDPSYEYTVQVDQQGNGKMILHKGLLLHTSRDRRTLRVHDLRQRKELLAHRAEDAEYWGVVQEDPQTLLVYSYRRHRKFLLTQYNLSSGREGPTTEIPFPRGRRLEPSDVRVSANMLFITDGESLRAWATADSKATRKE